MNHAIVTADVHSVAAPIATACHAYQSEDPCVPCALASCGEAAGLPSLQPQRIKRGRPLYLEGDPFRFVHAVRTGTFKSTFISPGGHEQITGFQIAGEVLGLDGLGYGRHVTTAVALEDSDVLAIPYAAFAPGGPHQLHEILPRLLGRELVRRQKLAVLLSCMSAEQRLASFLLNLSRRMQARGYSPSEFHLRMTRGDIGCYLGLNLETVSRTFSAFQQRGLLQVHGRDVLLLDRQALVRCLDPARPTPRIAQAGRLHA